MSYKTTYNLDSDSNRISKIYFDYQGGSWIENWKYEYTYDTTQLMASITHPFGEEMDYIFEDFPYYHKVLGSNEFSHDGTQWNDNSRLTYHYDISAGTTDINQSMIRVYPNPTTDTILVNSIDEITISEVVLFDSTGKLILKETSSTINVKQLKTGVYNLKIIDTKGNTYSTKIIKR